MSKLFAAVGSGGTNAVVDVKTVQNLINASIRTLMPLGYLTVSGVCDSLTIEAIKQFQLRVVKLSAADGRVDPGGRTLQALDITASGGTFQPGLLPFVAGGGAPAATSSYPNPGADGRYTNNPNEVPTKKTVPAAKDVVAMVRTGWSELNEQGARTLTAQFLHETNDGSNCYNWNLGNVKALVATVMHNYLRDTWEPLGAQAAAYDVANSGGLGRIASAEEIKNRNWQAPGKTIAVFEPPHPYSRFLAYPSLAEGAKGWIGKHKRVAAVQPQYVKFVNAGDCVTVAFILKQVKYYTGNEGFYARNMALKKAALDRALGPMT